MIDERKPANELFYKTSQLSTAPHKCSKELVDNFCEAVRLGVPVCRAARLAGTSSTSIRKWRKRAADPNEQDEIFQYLEDQLQLAKSEFHKNNLTRIHNAADGGELVKKRTVTSPDGTETVDETYSRPQWQAAAWLLERRFPDDYALKNRISHEHSGTVRNENVNLNIEQKMTPAQAAQLASLTLQALEAQEPDKIESDSKAVD